MNFQEAVQAMKEGKKVRRNSWGNKDYHYGLNENMIVIYNGEKIEDNNAVIIDGDDWELYGKNKTEEKIEDNLSKHLITDPSNVFGIVPIKKGFNINDEFALDFISVKIEKKEWIWKKFEKDNIIILGFDEMKLKLDKSVFSYDYIKTIKRIAKEFNYETDPEFYLPYIKESNEFIKNEPCLIIFGGRLVFVLAPRREDD